jgi:hypothetical protein
MPVINTQSRQGGGSGDFKLLETDVYRCKIVSATIEEDQYAEPLNDGTKPLRLVLRWEVSEVSEEQDEEAVGCAVWQRLNPWYGTTRDGGPSRFKAFIDGLREQNMLSVFDPNAFDIDALVGIEQRVNVEKYAKTMGPNAGKPGNKVVAVMPLRRPKKEAKPTKNVPVAVSATVEEEDLPF